jgi:UDP-N-acetyl-2-amino-2-deoxyglucuronate dehydrogenase
MHSARRFGELGMLKFVLVGCGRISKRHSELLGNGAIARANLVAVCDHDFPKAEAISRQFSVPAFADFHEMMRSVDCDVVVVLTESGHHAEHVIALAPYGRHIIVEKPMALTLESADAMTSACTNAGIKLFVVKQNRFNVPVVKLREAIEQQRFGRLTMGTVRVRWSRHQHYYDQAPWRGTWALDGGVLTNQASHHVDLLEWMMGPVETVIALSATALAKIEAEDTAVVILRFKSGALGVIEATTAVRPKDLEGSISILGEYGSVEIGGFAVNQMKVWNFVKTQPDDNEVMAKYSVNPPNVYGFGHKAYYDHVVACLCDGALSPVDSKEGRKSVELINAIYESIETGKEVRVGEVHHTTRLGQHAS